MYKFFPAHALPALFGTALCFWLLFFAAVVAAQASESAGTVKFIKGKVAVERNGKVAQLRVGAKLMQSDTIVTGPDSSIGITLQDSTLLSFGPRSRSQLDEFRFDATERKGNLLISVLQGSMRFVTGLIGKLNPAAVRIKTPGTTLGVRGTDFIVSVEPGE